MSENAKDVIEAFERGEVLELRLHPAAEIFPRLAKRELKELADDIKKNGLRDKITLHPEGSILDGNNRFKACLLSEVRPQFTLWKGPKGGEIDFVVSRNLARRHLNESQRSIVAAKIAKLQRGRPGKSADLPNVTQGNAAAALNVSPRNARKAGKILQGAPKNVADLVEAGKLTVNAAEAVILIAQEDKDRIGAMSDEDAVAEVKRMAKAATEAKRITKAAAEAERLAKEAKPTEQDDAATPDLLAPESAWNLMKEFRLFITKLKMASDSAREQFSVLLAKELEVDPAIRELLTPGVPLENAA
jgi:hypothetical protein